VNDVFERSLIFDEFKREAAIEYSQHLNFVELLQVIGLNLQHYKKWAQFGEMFNCFVFQKQHTRFWQTPKIGQITSN
jgi:hypothetical protein